MKFPPDAVPGFMVIFFFGLAWLVYFGAAFFTGNFHRIMSDASGAVPIFFVVGAIMFVSAVIAVIGFASKYISIASSYSEL